MGLKHSIYGTAEPYDRFLKYDETPACQVFRDFTGGMGTDTLALLLNARTERGNLSSVCAPKDAVFENGFVEGAVKNICYADGVLLFRKGTALYAHKNGVFSVVTEEMLSEDGEIYDHDGRFYIVDSERILCLDRDLHMEEIEQDVPLCFRDVSRSGAYYTEVAPMNPFCRFIDITLSDEAGDEQKFPLSFAIDPTYARAWHKDGREVYPGYLILREDRVIFDGDHAAGCRLRLRLLDAEDEDTVYSFSDTASYREMLARPQRAELVSLSGGKTMLLIAKGRELFGVILGDLGFGAHNADTVLRYDCLAEITGLVPFDEGYLLFFEDAVKKLSIEEKSGEVCFAVTTLKGDFGSDMPGSIALFDDKIVFASSKGGVSCIDRFGVSEKIGCRRISANIEHGEYGFFSHDDEAYRKASAFAAVGDYYLTVGDITYVWDYRAALPTTAQTHRDEANMVWHIRDTVKAERYLAFLEDRLYYTERGTGMLRYISREGSDSVSLIKTAETDLGQLSEKTLIECGICYRAEKPVSLSIICDGKEHLTEYIFPAADTWETRSVRIYGKRFLYAALALSCEGKMEIDAFFFRYL